MRKLLLLPSLGLLVLLVACGSGTNAGFGTSTIGDFSNSSMKGNYTYEIAGWDLSGTNALPFREAGVFTADGNGNITAGEDDFSESTTLFSHTVTSGSYSISNDGTGDATLNFGNGGGVHVDITVVSGSLVYLLADTIGPTGTALTATGYGNAALQTSSAFSVPSGTFVFRRHTVTVGQTSSVSAVGVITVSGGVVSGSEDVNQTGAISQRTITSGVFNTPDSQGRGTGSFTDSGGTTTFAYYVVDGSTLRFFSTDTGIAGLGEAESQSGGPTFSAGSLSGSYAFGADGDDSNTGLDGVKTVGRFTADGSGTLTDGALDATVDGATTTNASFAGTYTVASNGRGTATPSGVTLPIIFYLVSPSRAFFLVNNAPTVEDGTLDQQQTSSFTNASMNGQYGFYMDGFDTTGNLWDRVGWLRGDGSSNLTLSELLNEDGSTNTSGLISGTYSVGSNGRATGSINNLSNNLVFYLISGSSGYILQNDTGFQISGYMTKQQAP